MFHLLPEKEKKVLEAEYRYRLLLVGLIFILASLVVASVFLLPSYLLSARRLTDVSVRNDQVKNEIKTKTDPSISTFLSTLKDNLAALKPTQKTPNFSTLVKEITDKKTTGIGIDSFSRDGKGIIIGGQADNRDNLIRFSRDLQMVADFSKVDLPISDFAKDKNINFSITITLKTND